MRFFLAAPGTRADLVSLADTFGSDALKEKFLPDLATGTKVGCFGLTEPDHGSDPAGMVTEASEAPGGGFVISGAKTWISNSPIADVFVVWAKCKWDGKIRGFVLEKVSLLGVSLEVQWERKLTGIVRVGMERIVGAPDQEQALASRFDHWLDLHGRGGRSSGQHARRSRSQGSLLLLEVSSFLSPASCSFRI